MANFSDSTTSPKIQQPVSRRNFIASSAVLAVASVSPAIAFPSGGHDAELIELGGQLETLDWQYTAASKETIRLHGLAPSHYPPLPDVLKARPTDKLFDLPKPNGERFETASVPSSTAGYYTSFHLNALKQFRPSQRKRFLSRNIGVTNTAPKTPLPCFSLMMKLW